MSAAEFIVKNKIDLFNAHGSISDGAGNIIMEGSNFWLFRGSDGHTEKVYL